MLANPVANATADIGIDVSPYQDLGLKCTVEWRPCELG
jgi:hypothetical protein